MEQSLYPSYVDGKKKEDKRIQKVRQEVPPKPPEHAPLVKSRLFRDPVPRKHDCGARQR